MKVLIKTTIAIGVTEVAVMLVAVFKNKYLAISVGPEGIGIYGLILSFFNIVVAFSGTWLATGATKYVAEYNKEHDHDAIRQISSFSLGLAGAIATITAIGFIFAEVPIRRIFLTEDVLTKYFILFSIASIGASLRPVFIGLLTGLKQARTIVFAQILTSLMEIGLAIGLISLFGLMGFFLSIFISSVFAVLLLTVGLRKTIGKIFVLPDFRGALSSKLLAFGGVNLCLAIVNLSSQYFQRIIVVKQMNLSSVGFFYVGAALMGYLGIVSRGSTFYFYPKMSERLEPAHRNSEINNYLRFVLMVTTPICVACLLFGAWVILLLTSSDFLPLVSVFTWFVLAAIINVVNGTFQSTIVGMAKLKVHSLSTVVTHCLWVAFPLFLIRRYGIGSLGMGFVAGGAAALLINFVFLRQHIGLRLFPRTVFLLVIAVVTFTGGIVLQDVFFVWRLCWIAATAILLGLTVNRKEWAQLYHHVLRWRRPQTVEA